MLVQLKYKNDLIPGYFISDEGKIYNVEGIEQKQYLKNGYYFFKSHGQVHRMMIYSFYGYKEGFVIHHKNQIKTDNRLQNLVYLTCAEHRRLHMTGKTGYWKGKKLSEEHKEKVRAANKGKTRSEAIKQKMRAAQHKNKKPVYCVELDRVFGGVSIAAKELSLSAGHISSCCQEKRKTCGGYHFEYYQGDLI